jgi:rhamnosyltransferase
MDVSIIIRTRNEAESVHQTLKRVEEQEFGGRYEVIIVDSGSTDSTLDIVRRHNVKILQISPKEFSYGRSLNLGANEAKGLFVVNLSAHAFPKDRRWLTNLVADFGDCDVAATYGRQQSFGRINPFEALLNEMQFGERKIRFNLKDRRMLKKISFTNSNAAVRSDVWQRFKFNEKVPYGEDILWQSEVTRAGFSIVYAPNAAVYHTHRVSIRSLCMNSMNCAYNLSLIHQKRQWLPLVGLDVVSFLGLIPISIVRNARYIWRNSYYRHAIVIPFWVLSGAAGSVAGKIRYRAKRQFW